MSFSRINDKNGDKTKTFIINTSMREVNKKMTEINNDLNNKIANIHKKFKGGLNSNLLDLIKKNKNDIKTCVLERQKNDKDIDKINAVIKSNQNIIKQLLTRCEYLEERLTDLRRKEKQETIKKELESIVEEEAEEN